MGRNNKLNKILAELEEKIQVEVRKSLEEGAQLIVDDAKGKCPESHDEMHGNPPGTLRNSIQWKWKGNVIKITAPAKAKDGTPYGQYVEFWPERKRPFMIPALQDNIDKVREDIIEAIQRGVNK